MKTSLQRSESESVPTISFIIVVNNKTFLEMCQKAQLFPFGSLSRCEKLWPPLRVFDDLKLADGGRNLLISQHKTENIFISTLKQFEKNRINTVEKMIFPLKRFIYQFRGLLAA